MQGEAKAALTFHINSIKLHGKPKYEEIVQKQPQFVAMKQGRNRQMIYRFDFST